MQQQVLIARKTDFTVVDVGDGRTRRLDWRSEGIVIESEEERKLCRRSIAIISRSHPSIIVVSPELRCSDGTLKEYVISVLRDGLSWLGNISSQPTGDLLLFSPINTKEIGGAAGVPASAIRWRSFIIQAKGNSCQLAVSVASHLTFTWRNIQSVRLIYLWIWATDRHTMMGCRCIFEMHAWHIVTGEKRVVHGLISVSTFRWTPPRAKEKKWIDRRSKFEMSKTWLLAGRRRSNKT